MKTWFQSACRLLALVMVMVLVFTMAYPVFAQAGGPADPPTEVALDLTQFLKVGVAGIPLIFVIVGIVGVLKKAGLSDKQLLFASVMNGLFWGSGYQVTQQRPPMTTDVWLLFIYWFAVLAYGAALAVVASLLYDLVKGLIDRLITRAITTLLGSQVDPDGLAQRLRKTG